MPGDLIPLTLTVPLRVKRPQGLAFRIDWRQNSLSYSREFTNIILHRNSDASQPLGTPTRSDPNQNFLKNLVFGGNLTII